MVLLGTHEMDSLCHGFGAENDKEVPARMETGERTTVLASIIDSVLGYSSQ